MITLEIECQCGNCEGDETFIVVEESLTEKQFVESGNSPDLVLCECDSEEKAIFIASSMNKLAMN
ncbi:hypothetical protein GR212_15905 [Rhizobium lusitanum]|uniref:Uncharacterized protein n=1 Tax=Rhizobium lusitanum TaxID=293958 RepID=A0A6L9U6Y7_9HYPH|nr:hypothetical protein [Rhizobium lusitanum]NEI71064.1 hypothetical protein [Rhizobium lusitanum]